MKSLFIHESLCALALVAGTALDAQAQVAVFNETFDPLSPSGSVQLYYTALNATGGSVGVVPGVGVGGTAGLQMQVESTSVLGGAGAVDGLYLNLAVSGNTSLDPSDYNLSFDAKATSGLLTSILVQTWDGPNASGNNDGTLRDDPGVGLLSSSFQHYSLNLGAFTGSLSGLGLAGGTYQLSFQYVVTVPTPDDETAVIDNLELTMVPEPCASVLLGLGALALGVCAKRFTYP